MRKKIIYLAIFIFLFLNLSLVLVPSVFAKADCCCKKENGQITDPYDTGGADCDTYCVNTYGSNSTSATCPEENNGNSGSSVSLQDPLGLNGNVEGLFVRIIKVLLGLVGIASLVAFVYAGFMFLISAGNSERVKKAKDTMVYAVLGIFISMAAYVILSFVFQALEGSL